MDAADEHAEMCETILRLIEADGAPRRDALGLAHAGLMLWAVMHAQAPAVRAYREQLRAAGPGPQGLAITENARLLRAVSPEILGYVSGLWWRFTEGDGFDEETTFELLWSAFDRVGMERVLAEGLA